MVLLQLQTVPPIHVSTSRHMFAKFAVKGNFMNFHISKIPEHRTELGTAMCSDDATVCVTWCRGECITPRTCAPLLGLGRCQSSLLKPDGTLLKPANSDASEETSTTLRRINFYLYRVVPKNVYTLHA